MTQYPTYSILVDMSLVSTVVKSLSASRWVAAFMMGCLRSTSNEADRGAWAYIYLLPKIPSNVYQQS